MKSRKLKVSLGCASLATIVPIIFKLLEIDNSITMLVVGAFIAIPAIYSTANVVDKKLNGLQ